MEKVKKPIFKKWWFWVIVVLVIGAIGSNMGDSETTSNSASPAVVKGSSTSTPKSTPTPTATPEPAITVTAAELAKAYEDNEVRANGQYKDKTAEITGKISSIEEMVGQTFVVLSSEVDFSLTNVQCFFKDKDEVAKLSELNKGDKVTIIGKIDGKSLNVSVNNCKLK